jgi:hypothetical protein
VHLRNILKRVRKSEQGFSMVVTMGAVAMLLISSAAAIDTVYRDQDVGRRDTDRKAGYAAAEAGLQVYVHKLLLDNTYWTRCAIPADGVNQPFTKGSNPETWSWQKLPDNTARYAIEVVPVAGKTKCDPADPEGSMIEAGTPTFRIRITGQALSARVVGGTTTYVGVGPRRSLIATFKRKSFLDYIYFTDIEAQDPALYPQSVAHGRQTLENAGLNPNPAPNNLQRSIDTWGADACSKYSYTQYEANKGEGKKLRPSQLFRGTGNKAGIRDVGVTAYTSWTQGCVEIQFVQGDWIQGPLHTNDMPLLCGSPKFGRNPTDIIEIVGPADATQTLPSKSWRSSGTTSCGTSTPDVNFDGDPTPDPGLGTWRFNQAKLQLPSTNVQLKAEAPPAYSFRGETHLKLTSSGLQVVKQSATRADGSVLPVGTTIGYPPDGVIYVDNGVCASGYSTANPYASRPGCGVLYISGSYNTSLTMASADDIVIDGEIFRDSASTAVLGLVSNNFIRVYHPVTDQTKCANGDDTTDAAGTIKDFQIDAALLALKHSFIVDNWGCGDPLGTLTINGAISQKFRGTVGTGSGKTSATGYLKLYKYDDRLRVRIPPKFIDPVESAWGIQAYQEQSPAQGNW